MCALHMVAKLFIRNHNIYELVQAQSDNQSDQTVLDLKYIYDRMLYTTDGDDAMFLVQTATSI